MKIDIQLTPEELAITATELKAVYNSKASTRKERSTLSMAFDVAKIFEKKVSNIQHTLFSIRKTTKITLKHHEADILELLLIQQMTTIEPPEIRRIVQSVIAKLNQKLT